MKRVCGLCANVYIVSKVIVSGKIEDVLLIFSQWKRKLFMHCLKTYNLHCNIKTDKKFTALM